MNRKEFLEILRSQLAGQMQEGKAAAHIRYYGRLYTVSGTWRTFRAGSTAGTGRPASDSKDSDRYRRWKYTGRLRRVFFFTEAVMAMRQSFLISRRKRWKKVIDLSTWHGRAVVIAAAAVIIVLLILIIGVAIPFFIILAIILYFLSWLKKRNDQ